MAFQVQCLNFSFPQEIFIALILSVFLIEVSSLDMGEKRNLCIREKFQEHVCTFVEASWSWIGARWIF
jgi:hypothetical protein